MNKTMTKELVSAETSAALRESEAAEKEREDDAGFGFDFWLWWSELPFVGKLCAVSGMGQVVLCVLTLLIFGVGPATSVTNEMSWSFANARNMLVPAYVMEACTLLSSSSGSSVRLTGYNMSRMVMLEFTVKLVAYSLMAGSSSLLVHSNLRSFGEPRPVSSLRYLEWSITVPIFLTMNNYPFIGNTHPKEFFFRVLPGLSITFGFILVSWVGLVTPNAFMGWFLLLLTNVTFAISVWDQHSMVKCLRDTTTNFQFKLGVVITKDIIFFAYGLVYFLSVFNLMTPVQEQKFYTYGDVVLKVWMASCLLVLRNWQDLVSVKRRLESQLSRSKEDTARLINKSNALMLVLDMHGCISGWNNHTINTTGISEKAAVGKKLHDMVRQESRASVDHALLQCRQGLCSGGIELELYVSDSQGEIDPSGSAVTILVTFVMQLGADTSSIIVVGQDLTELVARRALEERQARFESIVSHELRSPLHGIIGLSSVMAEASSDKMQKKQLGMIQGCADRLLDLVNNIMESHQQWTAESKDGDEAFLVRDPVNILEVIREVCDMTKASVDKTGKPLLKSGVKLVTKIDCKRSPVVQGDQQKLTQMLYNLTTNACNFTTKGSITLAVNADDDFGSGFMELEISDTGPGIAPRALRRIFEPFEQEDSKDTRKFQGVGLGLSVAQNIAKSHGGGISAKSNDDKGSVFVVRLPCEGDMSAKFAQSTNEDTVHAMSTRKAAEDIAMPDCVDASAMHEKTEQVRLRLNELRAKQERSISEKSTDKPFVLIVDKDQVSQQVLSQNLQSMARSHTCLTAGEAIEFLSKAAERPRLVIVDLLLPNLGGLEVCMEIRHRMKLSHVELPIIVLCTRTAREERANQAFWAGATDLVQMPFTGAYLRMRVKVSLDIQDMGVLPSIQPPAQPISGLSPCPSKPIEEPSPRSGGFVNAMRRKFELDTMPDASASMPASPRKNAMPKQSSQRPSSLLAPTTKSGAEVASATEELKASLALCQAKLEESAALQTRESARCKETEARLADETSAYRALSAREEVASSAKAKAENSLTDRDAQIQALRAELHSATSRALLAEGQVVSSSAVAASALPAVRGVDVIRDRQGAASIGMAARTVHSAQAGCDLSEDEGSPVFVPSHILPGMNPSSFWKVELDSCRKDVQQLRSRLSKEESAAYTQRTRADAREREIAHLRGQLRRARSSWCATANAATASEFDERLIGS